MQSRWDDAKARQMDDLQLRVYSSNLLGSDDTLVLHGGGNTSLKKDGVLYVKGSGWDLSSIEKEGFAPVKMDALLDMAKREHLSDSEMVHLQKEAMLDASAPNPSIEAILHALIPYKFVDHTHADAIVTITNSVNGEAIIKELFPNFLIVPYVMPGFVLAKKIYEMTKERAWEKIEGIILLNHGIFTYDDDAKRSYEKMIEAVGRAEAYLDEKAPLRLPGEVIPKGYDLDRLKALIADAKGAEVVFRTNTSPLASLYASQPSLAAFASRGVLTPEHIIRTKRAPMVVEDENYEEALSNYIKEYKDYFEKFATDETMLNPAPNYIVLKDFGWIAVGKNEKEAGIIDDIVTHTARAVLQADKLGGYRSICLADSFDMEYWELEQAKLKAKR